MAVTDIHDALGEQTVAQISENGGEAIYLHLDVREEADWVNAIGCNPRRAGRAQPGGGWGSILTAATLSE